jgi:hypothetical protein
MLRANFHRVFFSLFALGMAIGAFSQQGTPNQVGPKPVTQQGTVTNEAEELDAGEGLVVIGKKLWFEMRKRLNLTTAEEEAQQKSTEKRLKVNVAGIKLSGTTSVPKDQP